VKGLNSEIPQKGVYLNNYRHEYDIEGKRNEGKGGRDGDMWQLCKRRKMSSLLII
jgi:hypothetical protein